MPLLFCLTQFSFATKYSDIDNIGDINNIVQDDLGFIWLTSQQGLIRYDGREFINFSSNNQDWTLPFRWVKDAKLIENGNLLLASECCGIWLFNVHTGQNSAIDLDVKNKKHNTSETLLYKDNYYAYSSDVDQLYARNTTTNESKLIASNIHIRELLKTQSNAYAVNHTDVFQIASDTLNHILTTSITAATVVANKLVILTKDGLTIINEDSSVITKTLDTPLITATPHKNGSSFYAIDANNEIVLIDIEKLSYLEHNYPAIGTDKVDHIFHDRSGVLWLSTRAGIKRIVESTAVNHIGNSNLLANTIELIDNKLIIGTHGHGLINFDSNKSIFDESASGTFSPRSKFIYDSIAVNNILYLNTFDGLWKYTPLTKQLTRINIVDNNTVLLGIHYSKGKLYIGIDGDGFLVMDVNTEKIIERVDKTSNLSSAEVLHLIPVGSKIWLATAKGVDIYDPYSKQITTIFNSPAHKIVSLIVDGNKVLASSMGDGLYIFNQQGQLLSQQGSDIQFSSLSKINNNIWATARPGIYKLDQNDYSLNLIPGTESFSIESSVKKYNNSLYAPHESGILQIPFTNREDFHPKVLITHTTVSGKSYLLNKSIKLNSSNDVVTLELASLDYRPGPPKTFEYKINNGQWNKVNNSQITLTGLSPGDYYLEIRGTNSLEQWSKYHAFTNISVAFPWYWTVQMRIIYLVIAIGIVSLCSWLFYLRSKSIHHIYQALRNDSKSKGRAALNVTRNLKQVLESINSESAPEFDIKKVLEQSIEELTAATKAEEPDALYGKTLEVALPYFVQYMHRKHHINIKLSTELDSSKLSYELQADIYKIIYEAISSNMLNHSSRNFSISMQDFKGKVWLTIQDDNEGFTNYQSRISFDMAMYYIRQIASKYKASVNTFNNSHEGQGSQLVISIPLMKLD